MDFKSNTKLNKFIQLSLGRLLLFIIPIFIIMPNVTQAGLWSSVISIFTGQDALAQTETVIEASSQNMPLPEAALNIDPFADNCSDVLIVDNDGSLLSPSGPSSGISCEVESSGGSIMTYLVRDGDSYSKIAEMFGVSVNTILWYNNLNKNSVLKAGQTLYILPISGVMHTVVKGDTLVTIAKKYNGDINEIANFNNLKITDTLSIGDEILIPDGQVSFVSGSATPSSSGSVSGSYYMKPFTGGHKTQGIHGYNAVDYGMPVGTPLYAAASGRIIISKNSGWNGGYGNYVKIQHPNGTQTVYGHMQGTLVLVGQTVEKGDLIGYSGNSGNSTGPHLHFEIRGAKNPF